MALNNDRGKEKSNWAKISIFVCLLLVSFVGVNGAIWSCWFNDNPVLRVDVSIYNSSGDLQSTVSQNPTNTIDSITIDEGDILKFDFTDTTDDENNIQQERVYILHDSLINWSVGIQDTSDVSTTLSTSFPGTYQFDFYSYLTGGLTTKKQYFQETSQLIAYNDGNAQTDLVKVLRPSSGDFEVLFRVSDSCGSGGTDEQYHFFDLTVNEVENVSAPAPEPSGGGGGGNISFLGAGATGIYESSDGFNWTNQGIPTTSDSMGDIIYSSSEDLYLALGLSPGTISTSTDGTNWTERTNAYGSFPVEGVTYSELDDLWVVVGNGIQTSSDGITWTQRQSISGLNDVAYSESDDLWVTAGPDGFAYTSGDGISWTQRNNNFPFDGFGGEYYVARKVIYSSSEDLFVMVGDYGGISTSSDGITWTARTSGVEPYTLNDVAYSESDDLWVSVGDEDLIVTSSDGITWTQRSFESAGTSYTSVIYSESLSKWLAFANQKIVTSSDGITWSEETTDMPALVYSIIEVSGSGGNSDVYGCNDPNADNYNVSATLNDGSCTYTSYGCTDALALNYDSGASTDDGSCTYSEELTPNVDPIADLEVTSNQVTIGDEVCWDISDSYDADGSITETKIIENGAVYVDVENNCFTSVVPDIVEVSLLVTDNDGATDSALEFVAFQQSTSTCSGNSAPTLTVNVTETSDNHYWLNASGSDSDLDDLSYSWSINGLSYEGQNLLLPVAYNQYAIATVTDDCNITTELEYIDVGVNDTQSQTPEVDIICTQTDINPPSTVTCVATYDIGQNVANKTIWNVDGQLTEDTGSLTIAETFSDELAHIITFAVTTTEGYMGFDSEIIILGESATESTDGGAGGGVTVTPDIEEIIEQIEEQEELEKDSCSIDLDISSISLDDETLIQEIKVTNNEDFAFDPQFNFIYDSGDNSIFDKLRQTNDLGILDTGITKSSGVRLSSTFLVNGDAQGFLEITSTRCKKLVVPINIEISNQSDVVDFFGDFFGAGGTITENIEDLGSRTFIESDENDSSFKKLGSKLFSVLGITLLGTLIAGIGIFLLAGRFSPKPFRDLILKFFSTGLASAVIFLTTNIVYSMGV
jgi:hypothetical protein